MIETLVAGKALDMKGIWAKQAVSAALDAQLASISRHVFEVIVNPDVRLQNVTEWAKKELCWERVRALNIPFTNEFRRELIDKEEIRAKARDARVLQRMDVGIDSQATVVTLGAAFWLKLDGWARPRRLLTESDERLLRYASRIPHRIPSERESIALLSLKQRIEEEGFNFRS